MNARHRIGGAGLAMALTFFTGGCDGEPADAGTAQLSDVVGYWTQIGCSDDQGGEIDCLAPVSEVRRDLRIDEDGTVTHLFALDGGTADGGSGGSSYVDGEICNPIVGCYPAPLVDGSLLYCLSATACEMFER